MQKYWLIIDKRSNTVAGHQLFSSKEFALEQIGDATYYYGVKEMHLKK